MTSRESRIDAILIYVSIPPSLSRAYADDPQATGSIFMDGCVTHEIAFSKCTVSLNGEVLPG